MHLNSLNNNQTNNHRQPRLSIMLDTRITRLTIINIAATESLITIEAPPELGIVKESVIGIDSSVTATASRGNVNAREIVKSITGNPCKGQLNGLKPAHRCWRKD